MGDAQFKRKQAFTRRQVRVLQKIFVTYQIRFTLYSIGLAVHNFHSHSTVVLHLSLYSYNS